MGDATIGKLLSKKNIVDLIGYRISVLLDDGSKLTGRLVSVSAYWNIVLTDVEREFTLKRHRDEHTKVRRIRREQYLSVLFVRGSSIVSVSLTKGVTTEPNVVDAISGVDSSTPGGDHSALRVIKVANMNPISS